MQGIFITIEGADGSGKTTQTDLLKKYFDKVGIDCIFTREPGGTIISEAIREIILDKSYMEMSDKTEVLLYAASRAQHVEQKILPALQQGKIVICDRYIDSSIAYQGVARGIGMDEVKNINQWATSGLEPDITILLDLDPEVGILRKQKQKNLDRLELQQEEFHRKVVEGYKILGKLNPDRILSIDASLPIEEIHRTIVNAILNYINNNNNKRGNLL